MSRRRQSNAALAERANRFKAIQAELMQALPDTAANRQRAETVALIDMASDHVRQAILHGQPVEIGALERLAAARASILPAVNTRIDVHFVDGSDLCLRCRAPLPPREEREPVMVEAPAVMETPAPQPAAAQAAPPPSPAPANNVTPLRPALQGNTIAELVANVNAPASGLVISLPQDGRDSW